MQTAADGGACGASHKAPAVRHASVSASVSTANASTCHYLVVGVGLQHGGSQTEMPEPEQPEPAEPEQPRGEPEPEPYPEESSTQPEPEQYEPEPQAEGPETEIDTPPPPVFADCSHYNATSMTSRGRGRRRGWRAHVSESLSGDVRRLPECVPMTVMMARCPMMSAHDAL